MLQTSYAMNAPLRRLVHSSSRLSVSMYSYSNFGKIKMTHSRSGSLKIDSIAPLSIDVEKQCTDNLNAGIRIVSNEENGSLFLWKTPNVAILQGEKLIRPASVSVAEWMIAYFSSEMSTDIGITKAYTPTLLFPTMLSSETSGIVTIAKNKKGFEYFHQACESKSLHFSYTAVVFKSNSNCNTTIDETCKVERMNERTEEPDICNKLIEDYLLLYTNNQNGITEDLAGNITTSLIETSNSETYERLYLINIKFSGTYIHMCHMIYIRKCIYIYMFIYIYIHTYICIYIHVYICIHIFVYV
jgi:hypothetical protein